MPESHPASSLPVPAVVDARAAWAPFAIVLGVGVALAVWLGTSSLPCPNSDEAFYRSPAAELIQHGRLAIPCVGRFIPRSEEVFACYPPLFQLLLSGWFWVFGFSLGSSLAFTYTVHLLGALAIMVLTRRALAAEAGLSPLALQATVLAVGLIQVANLAYFDRQEETALLWLWIELLWIQGPGLYRALASGLLVGLAGLTSPWVGLLGALTVTFRTLGMAARPGLPLPARIQAGLRLGAAALLAATLAAAWAGIMEYFHPGIINDQFVTLMRQIGKDLGPPAFQKNLHLFSNSILYNIPQLPVLAATLLLFPLEAYRLGWRQMDPTTLTLNMAGMVGILVVAYVRPDAYTYLGAVQILLLPCFGPAVSRYLRGSLGPTTFGLVILVFCTLFAWQQAAALAVLSWRLPAEERLEAVSQRLREHIPPEDTVAVTGSHWYCFQDRNRWLDAYFASRYHPEDLLRCRWLVLPPGMAGPALSASYELVEEIATEVRKDQTYAYSLWRRRDR